MKKLLILGGTRFVGRTFVEYILQNHKDDDVTIANRNISNKYLFMYDNVRKIVLNRDSQYSEKIDDKKYDAIIDFSGYTKQHVKNIIPAFNFKRYIFISSSLVNNIKIMSEQTSSQYKNLRDEALYTIHKFEAENLIKINVKSYSIIRPCYVVGDYDYTDRFVKTGDLHYNWKYQNIPLFNFIESKKLAEIIYKELDREENIIITACQSQDSPDVIIS